MTDAARFTQEMRDAVSQLFVRLCIIRPGYQLPEASSVKYCESEQSTTSYYLLDNARYPFNIVATKYALGSARKSLWDSITSASDNKVHQALLPIEGNTSDDEFIVYDDGRWIAETLKERGLLEETSPSLSLFRVISGRAGISRVYDVTLSNAGIARGRQLLVKFDRPDRLSNEWDAIDFMRKVGTPREIILPLMGNVRKDGVIVYDSFGTYAKEVVALDEFVIKNRNAEHQKIAFRKLHTFLRQLYRSIEQDQVAATWGGRYPKINQIIRSFVSRAPNIYEQKCLTTHYNANITFPNPIFEVGKILDRKVGIITKSNVHGDLQLTNILLALAELGEPDQIGVIDIEKLENGQAIADDLAGLEADFVRSIFLKLFRELDSESSAREVAPQILLSILDQLAGRPPGQSLPIEAQETWLANVSGDFILNVRKYAESFLQGNGATHYDPTEYFHFLFLHYLRSLQWTNPANDPLQADILLVAASSTRATLENLKEGAYHPSGGKYSFLKNWQHYTGPNSSAFPSGIRTVADRPSDAIRRVAIEECGSLSFLTGETLEMGEAFCEPTVRARLEAESETASLIQGEVDKMTAAAGAGGASRRRPVTYDENDSFGTEWPLTSLYDWLDKHAGPTRIPDKLLLLIDEPGGGKTTTLRNIVWRVAKGLEPFQGGQRDPIFIPLGEWAKAQRPPYSLPKFLANDFMTTTSKSHPVVWPEEAYWQVALNRGSLFLALDGLDELGSGSDPTLTNYLSREISGWIKAGNCVVMTCRARSVEAYRFITEESERLRIHGLGLQAQQQFVHNHPSIPNKSEFMAAIHKSDMLGTLAANPFLLDVLCFLAVKERGQLPETRNEIIGKAISKILVDGQTKYQQKHSKEFDAIQLDLGNLTNLLADVALQLRLREVPREQKTNNRFSTQELFESLLATRLLTDKSNAKRLGEFICSTRLLSLPPEVALHQERIGSFTHGLFLEWLAALGMAQHIKDNGRDVHWKKAFTSKAISPADLILGEPLDPSWLEILAFLPSHLNDPLTFFNLLFENSTDDLTHGRLVLALRALVELPRERFADGKIKALAEAIGQSAWKLASEHWTHGTAVLAPELTASEANIPFLFPGIERKLKSALASGTRALQVSALESLERIGPSASGVAGLLRGDCGLRHPDKSIRELAGAALIRMGPDGIRHLIDGLNDESWHVQMSACEAIALLGPSAYLIGSEALVDEIIQLTGHNQMPVRIAACEALGRMGDQAPKGRLIIETLTKSLADEGEIAVRACAAQALGRLARLAAESAEALASLVMSIETGQPLLCATSVDALENLATHLKTHKSTVLNSLERLLRSTEFPQICASACQAFSCVYVRTPGGGEITPTANQSIEELLRHTDVKVRISACEAIWRLRQLVAADYTIGTLFEALVDDDWSVRSLAANAFRLVSATPDVFVGLITLLKDDKWTVCASACEALGHLISNAATGGKPGIDNGTKTRIGNALCDVLVSRPESVARAKAVEATAKLCPERISNLRIVENIIKSIEPGDDWYLRTMACDALGNMLAIPDTYTERVIDRLLLCLEASEWCVRAKACRALRGIAHRRERKVIEGLIASLCDSQEPVRAEASQALMHIARSDDPPMRIMAEDGYFMIKSKSDDYRIAYPEQLPWYLQFRFKLSPRLAQ
jgi:HEAT repeat protein